MRERETRKGEGGRGRESEGEGKGEGGRVREGRRESVRHKEGWCPPPPPPTHTHFQDATYIVHHNFKTKPEGYIIHVPADHSGELAASPVSIPAVPQLSGHTLSGEREREKGKGRGEKIAIYYCVYSVHVYVCVTSS